MDIEADKEVCGTCRAWTGKRERDDDGTFHVVASSRGKCLKRDKVKPPHGGCDDWTKSEEKEDG